MGVGGVWVGVGVGVGMGLGVGMGFGEQGSLKGKGLDMGGGG